MNDFGPEYAPSPKPNPDGGTSAHAADALSLRDFIDPLVSSWVSIAVIALIGAGVAFTLASLRRPVYEATAVVRIAGNQADAARAENLRRLLENRTIASEVIQEFGVTSDPAWTFLSGSKPPAADAFLENHVNFEQVPGTNLMRVRVRLGNAELAAKVANEWVVRGNALSRRISQQDTQQDAGPPDKITKQLEEADKRLETLKADLLALKKGAVDVRTTLLEVQTAIEFERVFMAYVDFSRKYEDPRNHAAARLEFVDPAMTPSAPLPPRAIVIAQLGGVLALLVACLLVLGHHFLYRHSRR
jgi:uncharacterized protein involved in exopolysaccharide biosynthesis